VGASGRGEVRGRPQVSGSNSFVAPFAFLADFSPVSFERMCRIVSIIARITSGPVNGASCALLGVRAHARRLKQWPDIGAAVAADSADETLFQVGQPHVIGP
jgi:hypothetical protein